MFGDFNNQFGLNQFLQSMQDAQKAAQAPFGPGQVDAQGGMFGEAGQAPPGSLHELGLGAGGSAGPRGAAAPTGSAGAQGPVLAATGGGSPLAPGGAGPMAPGARPQPGQLPQTNLEKGAGQAFQGAGGGGEPGMPQQRARGFQDLMV